MELSSEFQGSPVQGSPVQGSTVKSTLCAQKYKISEHEFTILFIVCVVG